MSNLLLENGSALLLESGSTLLLEDGPAAPAGPADRLLLEDGSFLLLEDGFAILLEGLGLIPFATGNLITRGFGTNLLVTRGFTPKSIYGQLRPAVAALLANLVPLTGVVSSRIFFGAFPESTTLPAIAFSLSSRDFSRNLTGSNGVSTAQLSISVLSYAEATSDQIAVAIRDRFDGLNGTFYGAAIMSSFYEDESDSPMPPRAATDRWTYLVETTYSIKHRVNYPASLGA